MNQNNPTLRTSHSTLIKQLTLEEKAGLLSGFDYWHTKPIERLSIPALSMADGPHGLRKQKLNELGINKSHPCTCFPTASLLACSWDEELAQKQGEAIGREARQFGLSCVLGPGINIKRSPLCGRNFEYFSEDPLLSGRMGAGIVNGLQSTGVSACIKHFAVNNQEDYRFWVDAKVDERTLREIYLAGFEYALMYSKPKAIMCSYNKINGIYASENRWLLTDVLRNEWGYDGIVMSDWGAVNNRPQGVWAGLDLEMPSSFGANDKEIIKAVNNGLPRTEATATSHSTLHTPHFEPTDPNFNNTLTEEEVDVCVERILRFVHGLEETITPHCDLSPEMVTEHHKLAREIAAESMVLLKNNDILPLKKGCNVAVVGDIAVNPVFQGGGSSRIVSVDNIADIPFDCIGAYSNATYVKCTSFDEINDDDIEVIKKADAVIIFAGMPDNFDTEGSDRRGMRLPTEQYELVNSIVRINKETVTVLCVGAPVEIPKSPALLMAYLGGQAIGGAVADLLFGEKNPCGRLAETFPCYIEETSSYLNFPGDGTTVHYGEGVNVGYRWYRETMSFPEFSFGHGLSYTKFAYNSLSIEYADNGIPNRVSVKVENIGGYDGKEVVQLYINGELKGFKKVLIKKGESRTVTLELTARSFSYWSVADNGWYIKGGDYSISFRGAVCPHKSITLESNEPIPKVTMYTEIKRLHTIPNGRTLIYEIGGRFGYAPEKVDDLINTRDCSSFIMNILRNTVTMYNLGYTFEEVQGKIDEINELNKCMGELCPPVEKT